MTDKFIYGLPRGVHSSELLEFVFLDCFGLKSFFGPRSATKGGTSAFVAYWLTVSGRAFVPISIVFQTSSFVFATPWIQLAIFSYPIPVAQRFHV